MVLIFWLLVGIRYNGGIIINYKYILILININITNFINIVNLKLFNKYLFSIILFDI